MVMRLILLSIFTFLLIPSALAQLSLEVEVTPAQGSQNDIFLFKVIVHGSTDINPPILTGGEGFSHRYIGPERALHIVNGERRASVTFNYQLQPRQKGTLLTPSVEIRHRGELLRAGPKRIEVTESTPSQAGNPEVQLKQTLSRQEVYVGQQTVHLLELISPFPLVSAEVADHTFDGFWAESFAQEEAHQRQIGGTPHTVHTLRRALFALTEGKKVIEPREARVRARVRVRGSGRQIGPFSMDLFDRDFFAVTRMHEIDLRSNPLELEVLPLPPLPNNRRAHTTPQVLVGATTLSAGYNTDPIDLGQGKTVTYRLETFGNTQTVRELPIPQSSQYRVYPEQSQTETSLMGGEMLTRKTFRVTVVPLSPGQFNLPPTRIIYFDPDIREYRLAETRPVRFTVTGDPIDPLPTDDLEAHIEDQPTDQIQADPTLSPPEQEILYREPTKFESLATHASTPNILWFILTTLTLLPFVWLALRRFTLNSRTARLLLAIRHSGSPESFSENLYNFFVQIHGITASSPEQLVARLRQAQFPDDFVFQLQSILDEFTIIRYSGGESSDRISLISEQLSELLARR